MSSFDEIVLCLWLHMLTLGEINFTTFCNCLVFGPTNKNYKMALHLSLRLNSYNENHFIKIMSFGNERCYVNEETLFKIHFHIAPYVSIISGACCF